MAFSESLDGRMIGNYQVLRELGRGSMGVVYQAHERMLQRTVALKVLPLEFAEDETFVRRFVQEARAAAQLNHPNIVHVYAVGECEGTYYIAMEFVKGQSLKEYTRERGQLAVGPALNITRQAAAALGEAHRHGIIHRDVKAQNIMLHEAGRVKVMDFGLAKVRAAATGLTSEGRTLGTPRYMSPEQVRAEEVDGRTDIYSLGVTLYEMLTGTAPFEADTPMTLMYQIVERPFPDVRDRNPDVPPAVAQCVTKMTARDRDQRYPSADALRADLNSLLHNLSRPQPSPAEPVPPPPFPETPPRRESHAPDGPPVAQISPPASDSPRPWKRWALGRKRSGDRAEKDAIQMTCSVCQRPLAFRRDDLRVLDPAECALVVRSKPDLVRKKLAEYVCPHCEAAHCFHVEKRDVTWIAANFYEPQTTSSRCAECRKPFATPPWAAGAYDGRLDQAPILAPDYGLVCSRCGAVCCVACCANMARTRGKDMRWICPRCFRQPMETLFHPS